VPPVPAAPTLVDSLEAIASVANTVEGYVTLEPEGIQVQSRVRLRIPQIGLAILDDVEQVYEQVPAPTYFLISGRDIAQQWRATVPLLEASPESAEALNTARFAVQATTGLDLDQDILGWMDGEFAAFLYPSRDNLFDLFLPQLDISLGVMVQTSDRATAETTLDALGDYVATNFDMDIVSHQINDQPVTSWETDFGVPEAPALSLFSYSWLNDNMLVMTPGIEPMSLLAPEPLDAIATAYPFTAVDERLPRPNNGYVFLNAGSTLSLVYQLLPPEWKTIGFSDIQRALGTVHSLSATTSSTERYIQVDFLFGLAPNRAADAPDINLAPVDDLDAQ
jgi:hypothetical protein